MERGMSVQLCRSYASASASRWERVSPGLVAVRNTPRSRTESGLTGPMIAKLACSPSHSFRARNINWGSTARLTGTFKVPPGCRSIRSPTLSRPARNNLLRQNPGKSVGRRRSGREGAVETGRVIGCLRVRPLNRPGVGGVGRDGTPVEQVGRYLDDVSPTGQALDLDSVQSVRQQQNGQLRRDRTVGPRHVNIGYKRGIGAAAQIRVFLAAPFQ